MKATILCVHGEYLRLLRVIIGGGVSGIASAIQLRMKLGLSRILIVERLARFGGTWEANTYPGKFISSHSQMDSLTI